MADSPYGSKDAQVFFPKNRVKDKVGQGGIATDLLQKAREAVTAMEQDYSSIVEEQLADIWEIFFETQDGTLDRQQGIQRILNAAFNLKQLPVPLHQRQPHRRKFDDVKNHQTAS
jgi:hypothetical protein